jgi:hypothetical protein
MTEWMITNLQGLITKMNLHFSIGEYEKVVETILPIHFDPILKPKFSNVPLALRLKKMVNENN